MEGARRALFSKIRSEVVSAFAYKPPGELQPDQSELTESERIASSEFLDVSYGKTDRQARSHLHSKLDSVQASDFKSLILLRFRWQEDQSQNFVLLRYALQSTAHACCAQLLTWITPHLYEVQTTHLQRLLGTLQPFNLHIQHGEEEVTLRFS